MHSDTAAIVGFGDLGERISKRLPADRWRCVALRRSPRNVPVGVRGVPVDVTHAPSLRVLAELRPALLVVTLTPAARDAAAYRKGFSDAMANIVEGLHGHQPRHAFFVSSTRVYAGSDGALVDETATLATGEGQASAIIDAEQRFLDALEHGTVLRAAGLYGQGPGALLKRVASGRLSAAQPPRYSNRIHRDDVAGFMLHLLDHDAPERIYNLVDDAPTTLQEVERWICQQLRRPWDPAATDSAAGMGKQRRISNSRLHATGYQLRYPTFREGYADVLQRWTAHSEREDGLDLH